VVGMSLASFLVCNQQRERGRDLAELPRSGMTRLHSTLNLKPYIVRLASSLHTH